MDYKRKKVYFKRITKTWQDGVTRNMAVKNCILLKTKGGTSGHYVQRCRKGIYWCFDSERYMNKDKSHTVRGGHTPLTKEREELMVAGLGGSEVQLPEKLSAYLTVRLSSP